MIIVGLTGGIGAGKSTVSAMLAARGAVIVDADQITHDLQRAGKPVFEAIVARFGADVVGADGQLDRTALAGIVFDDPAARAALNAIVHPAVRAEIARRVAAAPPDAVVVLEIPLLAETTGREGLNVVVTVEAAEDARLQRLMGDRGMQADEVRARMAAQAFREGRIAIADIVIENDRDRAHLEREVGAAWDRIVS